MLVPQSLAEFANQKKEKPIMWKWLTSQLVNLQLSSPLECLLVEDVSHLIFFFSDQQMKSESRVHLG